MWQLEARYKQTSKAPIYESVGLPQLLVFHEQRLLTLSTVHKPPIIPRYSAATKKIHAHATLKHTFSTASERSLPDGRCSPFARFPRMLNFFRECSRSNRFGAAAALASAAAAASCAFRGAFFFFAIGLPKLT